MHSKDSNYSTYKEMYKYMTENAAEVLPSNNDAGLTKVLREDYAFLMESSSIEYITERYCNVTQIGGLLDAKGYGIAMKKGKILSDTYNLSNNTDKPSDFSSRTTILFYK